MGDPALAPSLQPGLVSSQEVALVRDISSASLTLACDPIQSLSVDPKPRQQGAHTSGRPQHLITVPTNVEQQALGLNFGATEHNRSRDVSPVSIAVYGSRVRLLINRLGRRKSFLLGVPSAKGQQKACCTPKRFKPRVESGLTATNPGSGSQDPSSGREDASPRGKDVPREGKVTSRRTEG